MIKAAESSAGLRFVGDDLDPTELTALVGKEPTHACKKGERISAGLGRTRIAKTGTWNLSAAKRDPGDLDGQIQEIFRDLTNDLAVWRQLASKYDPYLYVGLFMDGSEEYFRLSRESMEILSSRGVRMETSMYGRSCWFMPMYYRLRYSRIGQRFLG